MQEKLGDRWKRVKVKGRSILKRVSSYGYRIPLLKSLEVSTYSVPVNMNPYTTMAGA